MPVASRQDTLSLRELQRIGVERTDQDLGWRPIGLVCHRSVAGRRLVGTPSLEMEKNGKQIKCKRRQKSVGRAHTDTTRGERDELAASFFDATVSKAAEASYI